MIPGPWKTVLIDYDVDPDLSSEVDLGMDYEFLTVIQDELDSTDSVSIQVAMTSGGTYYPLYALDIDSAADFVQTTTGLATARAYTFRLGCFRFIKVAVDASVTSDKTFYVRGFNRV